MARIVTHDESMAEDICQDVFERLYPMAEALDVSDERRVCALVKTATFHRALDYHRKGYRKYEDVNSGKLEEAMGRHKDESDGVVDLLLEMESTSYVKYIFQKLRKKDPINYEIYVRVKICDIPVRFVAEEFGLSENNVHNRVMRTKRWLKKEYHKISG